ncbi:MAG: hypothetical protein M1822_006728 [Bathelium mastoideum]|nr:MAG: hypothetical protein M1822_006728 [Bathelium mastoideum]
MAATTTTRGPKEQESATHYIEEKRDKSMISKSENNIQSKCDAPNADNFVLEIPESPIAAQASRSLPTPLSDLAPTTSKGSASRTNPTAKTNTIRGRVTKPKSNDKVFKSSKGTRAQAAKNRATEANLENLEKNGVQPLSSTVQHTSKGARKKLRGAKVSDKLEPLQLEHALARRTDWTPPKACQTAQLEPEISSPVKDLTVGGNDKGHAKQPFPEMVGNYNYGVKRTESASISPERSSMLVPSEGFLKRRRVEAS